MISEKMLEFYEESGIDIELNNGNIVWRYKGITIATYVDGDDMVYVYCHWLVNKKDPNRCFTILPKLKLHKNYYKPDGTSNVPWCAFKPFKRADFKEEIAYVGKVSWMKYYLQESIRLLTPRIQILKGKITMLNKAYNSKLPNIVCIHFVNIEKMFNIFNKERKFYVVKLMNGNVLKCFRNDDFLYSLVDNENAYFIDYTSEDGYVQYPSNAVSLPKHFITKTMEG